VDPRAGGQLTLQVGEAADVVRVAVRAHDAGDVLHRTPDTREVRAKHSRRAGMPRVDERDLVAVDEQVRLSPDEPHHMNIW